MEQQAQHELTKEESDLMSIALDHGKLLEQFIDRLGAVTTVDKRWLAIAKTDLQKGMMSLHRAIFKPLRF